jgi:(p)ppGpp synthase/HD superfamily hydrolase
MSLVSAAYRLAERHHAGQVDKLGAPYLDHVVRVAGRVAHLGPEHIAVALLHDVLEDTPATIRDLIAEGIPVPVVEAVLLLTKTGGPNADYYARVRANEVARAVKLADVADNSDPARLGLITDTVTRERLTTKYARAVAALA